MRQRRQQLLLGCNHGTHVDRRWNHVVGALAHVHMIVRMHLEACVAGDTGDHLVDIHIGAGAGAGLVAVYRKLIRVLALNQIFASLGDRIPQIVVEQPQAGIGLGGRALDLGNSGNKRLRHQLATDREVFHRALGLSAPERIRRYLYVPEAVGFRSEFAHIPSCPCICTVGFLACTPGARPWLSRRPGI